MSSSTLPTADPDFAAVKALFNAVCDLPDPLAALAASAADAGIQQRVRTLLDLEASQTTHFSRPVAQLLRDATQELHPGDRLGAWTLVRPLGHGGMGQVFLAERSDGHYQQRAAIKLLRGWSGDSALAQLARERQILAGLQHPHIARLIDGGSTPQGQPYLVLDYVEGQRIDLYLAGRGPAEALALFAQVGAAVAYAHRQLVVHCDLKPANVLVGSDGRAMLLDFGIAQLQGAEPGAELQALTPRYASPEQRAGRPSSAASDIYSLGAMLVQLLEAAAAPRPREWRAIVARACVDEPERRYPSVDALLADLDHYRLHQPVQALPQDATYVGAKWLRRRWPWALAGAGALVMAGGFTLQLVQQRDRALQAEGRARESATQAGQEAERARTQTRLAEAAQVQLRDERDRADAARAEAQAARDQATRERDLARAAERREQAQRRAAQQAEQVAQAEATTTREVSDFLVGLFDAADPRKGGRTDLPVIELVETGSADLEGKLADRPALRGRLQGVLARVYGNLSLREQARRLYEQAIAQERANPQPNRLREAALLSELAVVLANASAPAAAIQAARESLALRQARLPADASAIAESWNALGLALRSGEELDEARAAYAQSLAIRLRNSGSDSLEVASTLHNMGLLERNAGRLEAANSLLDRSAAVKALHLPEGHHDRVNTDRHRGMVLGQLGHTDQALVVQQRVAEQQRRLSGENSTGFARELREVAFHLSELGRFGEAIAAYEQVLAIIERTAPGTNEQALSLNNLAVALDNIGHPGAGQRFEQSLALRRKIAGPSDALVRRAELNLGRWLLRAGQRQRAVDLLQTAEAGAAERVPVTHDDRVDIQVQLALAELATSGPAAAEARAARLQAIETQLRPVRRARVLGLLGLIASARGEAAVALARQREAQAMLGRLPGGGPAAYRLSVDIELALATAAAGEADTVRQAWPGLRERLAGQHAESLLRQRVAPLVQALALQAP
ncbi:MAG: protein kinase domain-containing protein [Aquabacterium sp.]